MTPRKLKKLRQKHEIAQFALSKGANVSRFKISQYENSYGNLKNTEIDRINLYIKNLSREDSIGL